MARVNTKPSLSLVVHTILFLLLIFSLWLLSSCITLSYTNLNRIRDSVEVMIQIQATIIAIVIGLSLTAVQLATSAYSMRLFRFFWKNLWTWFLIVLYVFSILYNFVLLGELENMDGLESFITFSYMLCFTSVVLLIPYFYSMTDVLSPESIIKKLVKDIPDSIKFKGSEEWERDDPFQPIDDLICISIMKHDYRTASTGLEEITRYVEGVIISSDANDFDLMVDYFCSHMERLGRLALENSEEKLALKVIHNLESIGLEATNKNFSPRRSILPVITNIGIHAGKKMYEEVIDHSIRAIGEIGKRIKYENFTVSTLDFPHCEDAIHVVNFLDEIGKVAVMKWGVIKLYGAARYLGELGEIFTESRLRFAINSVVRSLHNLGVIALGKIKYPDHFYDVLIKVFIVAPLANIAKVSNKKRVKEGFERSVLNLWTIGIFATIKGLEETPIEAAKSLAELTILNKNSVDLELEELKLREKDIASSPSFKTFMEIYHGQLTNILKDKSIHHKK